MIVFIVLGLNWAFSYSVITTFDKACLISWEIASFSSKNVFYQNITIKHQ